MTFVQKKKKDKKSTKLNSWTKFFVCGNSDTNPMCYGKRSPKLRLQTLATAYTLRKKGLWGILLFCVKHSNYYKNVNYSVSLQKSGYLREHTRKTLFLELIGEGTHVKSLCCPLVQDKVQLIFPLLCIWSGWVLSFIHSLCNSAARLAIVLTI